MPTKFPEIRNFAGLKVQANSFDVPDGAMEVAENVYLKSDNTISKIPGFYTFDEGDPDFEISWMGVYDEITVSMSSDEDGIGKVVTYPIRPFIDDFNYYGLRSVATGLDPGYVYGSAEQNKNFYMAGENGCFKLEDGTLPVVIGAGIPPALDLTGIVLDANSGPLSPNSQIAYRVVFGRRDGNNNLNLSAPSDVFTVGLGDDATGASYTSSGAGPYTVTVTTTEPHGLSVGNVILVSNATDPDANGSQTITATPTATTFQYSTVNNPTSGTLNYTYSRSVRLEAAIPSELSDATFDYFVRFYRSTPSVDVDAAPEADFALIEERILTQDDLDLGVVLFTDDVDFGLEGAFLYTNPNTGEGEAQANHRPPKAMDIVLYKNFMLYVNTETRQRINQIQLLDQPSTIVISDGTTTESYVPNTTSGNRTFDSVAVAGVGVITITKSGAHGYSTGWEILILASDGTLPEGRYTITVTGASTFTISSPGNTATQVTFAAVTNGTNPIFYSDTTSTSVAQQIANTAQALVRAINRESTIIYANYISFFDDPPGRIRLETKYFSDAFTVTPSGTNPFIEAMPMTSLNDAFEDGIMFSKIGEPEAVPITNFARVGDPNKALMRGIANRESAIFVKEEGFFRFNGDGPASFSITPIDTTAKPVSRLSWCSLNNLVLGLTDQGVVAVTESSVQIISRDIDELVNPLIGDLDSVAVNFNGAVSSEHTRLYYLTLWSEVGNTVSTRVTQPVRTIVYNVINRTWSTCSERIVTGVANGTDLYIANQADVGAIKKQHNFNNLADFTGEFRMTSATAASDRMSAVFTLSSVSSPREYSALVTPEVGDAFVYNGAITKIQELEDDGLGTYTATFAAATNIPTVATDVFFYKAVSSQIRMAPYHAGQVSLGKQFSQLQFHCRAPGISKATIEFSNCYFGGSEQTPWDQVALLGGSSGWGSVPWGLFPWGLESGINLIPGTQSAPIVRLYIPRFAQRATYIQTQLTHAVACEPILIQAMSFSARSYGERVSR